MPAHRQLSPANVSAIRQSVHIPLRQLAAQYGVSATTIRRIRAGRTYQDMASAQAALPIPLPAGPYATAVIDPPWPIGETADYARADPLGRNRAAYPTMTLAAIADMPIAGVLAPDAWLLVWCTDRYLPDTLKMLPRWECEYRHLLVWQKTSSTGKPIGFQRPNTPALVCEFLVIAARGRPAFRTTVDFDTLVIAARGRHSEKPAAVYQLLARVCPAPRVDIFARQPRPGYDVWGLDIPGGFQPDGATFNGLGVLPEQLALPA